MPQRAAHIIIIGGNAAGLSAASRIRRNDSSARITVIEQSADVSYASCGLPYFISDDIRRSDELIAVNAENLREERDIDLLVLHRVTAFDPRRRSVTIFDEQNQTEQKQTYDRLIIASGASAIIPEIPGRDLEGFFTLRNLQDGRLIKGFVEDRKPQSAVIIGGGYVGLEMAEALRKQNVAVTIVEQKKHLMPQLDNDMAALIRKEAEQQGCSVITEARVTEVRGRKQAEQVVLACGRELTCDMVIASVGLKPNTDFARSAGIQTGPGGAIRVDSRQKTNLYNVFAAGDCAEVKNMVTNKYEYIPLGTTANKQGRVAGDNASGVISHFKGVVGTMIVKVFDLEVGRTGMNSQWADEVNLPVKSVAISQPSRAGYYPGHEDVHIKLIFRSNDGRLLGAQMVGKEGVAKRLDVLATALHQKMTVSDITELDLSYAPPFAPVWDPLLIAARQAEKELER